MVSWWKKANVYKVRWKLNWVRFTEARFEQSNLFETAAILREIYKLNLCNLIEFVVPSFNGSKIFKSICIYQSNIILRETKICSTVNNYPRQNITSIGTSSSINISKVFIRMYEIFEEGIFMKFPKFKASQFLIKHNKSNLINNFNWNFYYSSK